MATLTTTRMSREDFKKARELEELRKTGAAPPEVDADGQMINPHIPQYISQSPWYLNGGGAPGLKHQKSIMFKGSQEGAAPMNTFTEHYQRGKLQQEAPKKFVPGACTNCGATSHKAKDCVERPRRKGAALTGKDLQPAERVQQLEFTYDGKRDRWNGYDTKDYARVIKRFELTELERKKKKLQELDEAFEAEKQEEKRRQLAEEKAAADAAAGITPSAGGDATPAAAAGASTAAAAAAGGDDAAAAGVSEARRLEALKRQARLRRRVKKAQKASSSNNAGAGGGKKDRESDSDSDSDSDGEASDDEDMKDFGELHQKKDSSARQTVRNLRIRENTAKYLLNLDLNSAHFDPKSRSMRQNPFEGVADPKDVTYAGDNFVRTQGSTKEMQEMQSFVWESVERGNEGIHVQALPSQAEKLFADYKAKKAALEQARKQAIQEKYGSTGAAGASSSSTSQAPRELLVPVNESYVEYDETGAVVKGVERLAPKTKYAEDVLESGHKAVWGSWWNPSAGGGGQGQWGYACCHQTIRQAICTGEAGKTAAKGLATGLAERASFKQVEQQRAQAAQSTAAAAAASSASSAATAAAKSTHATAVKAEPDHQRMDTTAAPSTSDQPTERKRKRRERSRSSSSSSSSRSASSDSNSDSSSSSSSGSSSSSDSDSDSDSSDRRRSRRRSSKHKSRRRSSSRERKSKKSSRTSGSSRKADKKKQKVDDTATGESAAASSAPAAARTNARGYNSFAGEKEPSEKELDDYYRNKTSAEDPMANMPKDALMDG